jgi:hypothetical protein
MKLLNKAKNNPGTVLSPLMDQFLTADIQVRQFQSKHEPIFTAFQQLKEARDVAENELKTEAKRLGTGYETERVSCEYVMPMHRSYDPKILRERVSEKILNALGVIETVEKVNEKILKMLVKAKKIKQSVLDAAYVETPTDSPRVTITIKE